MEWNQITISYECQLDKIKAQSPYERLGIEHGSTLKEVNNAYRKKMRLYHPDRTDSFMSGHGEEISKLLNQAVEQIRAEINL